MLTMFTLLFKFDIELLVCVIKYEDDIQSSLVIKVRSLLIMKLCSWDRNQIFKIGGKRKMISYHNPVKTLQNQVNCFLATCLFLTRMVYLHLGHVSSLSNVLPLSAFHCTICLSKPLSINSLEKFNSSTTLLCSPAHKKKMLLALRVLSTMIPMQTISLIINKKGKSVRLPQNRIGRLISERECWYISNEVQHGKC